jgi:hypothetical protein
MQLKYQQQLQEANHPPPTLQKKVLRSRKVDEDLSKSEYAICEMNSSDTSSILAKPADARSEPQDVSSSSSDAYAPKATTQSKSDDEDDEGDLDESDLDVGKNNSEIKKKQKNTKGLLRNDVKGLREVPDSKKRKELADNVEKKA